MKTTKILSVLMAILIISSISSCKKKGCTDPLAVNYSEKAKKSDPDDPCVYASTDVENKNVILEEYTGVYCGYCPDGHKRAQEYHDAHPSDVFIIAIHEGYSSSQSGEDFTTSFGTALEGQIDLTGYPTGTVNRHNFSSQGWDSNGGTAMSRGNWSSAGNMILAEPSYVNLGASCTVNAETRVLTVNVDAYFTGTGASNNNLNVALLQSNIEGPQSGASGNPSSVLANGNYNHMHMLRHLVTGQWGENIGSNSSGSRVIKSYEYTIPADLNGVAYVLNNLDVVVFVTEGTQEIISGVSSAVSVE